MSNIESRLENDPYFRQRPRQLADRLNQLGLVYSDNQEYEKAEHFFTRCYELDPKHDLVLFERGFNYYLMGKKEEAKRDIRRWLKTDIPDDGFEPTRSIGVAYTVLGDYNKALEYMNQAIEESPKIPAFNDMYHDRARVYMLMGNRTAAKKDYEFVAEHGMMDSKKLAKEILKNWEKNQK